VVLMEGTMSDDPTPNADEPKGKAEFTPITSQDELNAAATGSLTIPKQKIVRDPRGSWVRDPERLGCPRPCPPRPR
jgi:hypothetical protein